jgi:Protein of unknown function (DUF4435)
MFSLRDNINAITVANDIRLRRQAMPHHAFVVVEGSGDKKLLSKFMSPDNAVVMVAFGKENVKSVVRNLLEERREGIVGIVDNDFDDLLGNTLSTGIIDTGVHDIEMIMFLSNSLNHLLAERADDEKIKRFAMGTRGIRCILLEKTAPLGCLRLISHRGGHALNFDELKFKFIDEDTLQVDTKQLVNIVVSRTNGCKVSRDELMELLQSELQEGHDLHQLCVGHDVLEILACGLTKCLGKMSARETNKENLESDLRIAFTYADLLCTELYRNLKTWEVANSPFILLATPSTS